MSDFYGATAGVCFVLLGFWWVVLQMHYERWFGDVRLRRAAMRVQLYFLLPGIVSIISLIGEEGTAVWRVTFVLAGLVGLAESVWSPLRGRARWTTGVGGLLFATMTVIAAVPRWSRALFPGQEPIVIEGGLLAALVLFGVHLVWVYFVSTALDAIAEQSAEQGAGAAPPSTTF